MPNLQRANLVIVVMLFALSVAACTESSPDLDSLVATSVAETVITQSEPSSVGPPQTVIFCPDCQLVEVTGTVDGDTIDTSIGRVRFFGVDTPERGEECFTEATEFTRLLVGDQVRLQDGPRLEDTYGRRLAYVFDSSGNSIDVQLVAGGFATAWTRDGQHRGTLIGLEESAKANQAGCLWDETAVKIPTPVPTPVPYSPSEVDYWLVFDGITGLTRRTAELVMPEYLNVFAGASATGQLEPTRDSFTAFVRSNDTTSLSTYSAELIPIIAASRYWETAESVAQRIANPTTQEDADIGCWIAYSAARLRWGSWLSQLGEMPGKCHDWYIDFQVKEAKGDVESSWIEWLANRLS
jgi:micrococcal nuclease